MDQTGAGEVNIDDALRRSSAHILIESGHALADDLVLDSDTEHHLARVLRLSSGEDVTVTDGAGRWRSYRSTVTGSAVSLSAASDIHGVARREPLLEIATAIPKGDRVEWLVQKATEIGVDRICLLHAERSVVRWKADRSTKQLVRLQKIADEALRQCRRTWRVEVVGPIDASSVLAEFAVAEPGGRPLSTIDRRLAIGPEGGWSDGELAVAAARVQLTPHVLRTETAVVAAATLAVHLA